MNTKVIFVTIVVGMVIAGTAVTFATPWQSPSKPFPDLGGTTVPLDEGDTPAPRGGTIDFSASTSTATMLFGANQGIKIPIPSPSNVFNLFSGDLKIANLGNGLAFPDGTIQYTASNGMFNLGKLCNALGTGWNNNIVAPDSWTASNCNTFASDAGATSYQIGCALSNGSVFGTTGGGIPSPNCGWNSACVSSGPYYPSAPTNGCLTPQKVIALANQASVTSGAASVTATPLRITNTDPVPLCFKDLSLPCIKTTVCGTPATSYATDFSCGTLIPDNKVDDNGTSCGTGNVYQVYCR